jgi:hypothetical protein
MAKWEATLFRKGAGCPACEGETPEGGDADEIAFRAAKHEVFCPGDDSGDVAENFIAIADGTSKRPAWERPEDPTKWSCAGCDAKVLTDLDTGEAYFENLGKGLYNLNRDASDADPELRDWVLKLGEAEYCPCCAKVCDGDFNCEAVIFRSHFSTSGKVLYGDTYDEGASFENPSDPYHGGSVCYGCFENAESEVA